MILVIIIDVIGRMRRLSIIVPLYNSAQYLPKCMDSLLHQDIPLSDYEIILVNDGSPDESLTIAQAYQLEYENVIVLSQENKGASGARNLGLRHVQGTYIRFVDPDDYIPANSVASLLAQMEREHLDMLRFDYQMVDEAYFPVMKPISAACVDYNHQSLSGADFLAEKLGYACYIWTFIYRTSVLKENEIFFYEGDYYDDTPWTPRVCLKSQRVGCTNQLGYYYYQRSNSLVRIHTPQSVARKIDGQMFLIGELIRQQSLVGHPGVILWYSGMIAHCAIGLLNLTTYVDRSFRRRVFDFLRKECVYPLSSYQAMPKTDRKIRIINISPWLYCIITKLRRI